MFDECIYVFNADRLLEDVNCQKRDRKETNRSKSEAINTGRHINL
jgi:hypothetical protein